MEKKDARKVTESVGSVQNLPELEPSIKNLMTKEENESPVQEKKVIKLLNLLEDEISSPPPVSFQDSSPSESSMPSVTYPAEMNIKGTDESFELVVSDSESSAMATIIGPWVVPTLYPIGMTNNHPMEKKWTLEKDDLYWQIGDLPADGVNETYDEWLKRVFKEPSFEIPEYFE